MSRNERTTMRLIAAELGVSVSLVSRALSGKAKEFRISQSTEQAILKSAKRHNYSPNRVARGLRLGKTNTLGLVVPNISNFFYSNVVRQVERAARDKGFSILLADSQDDEDVERKSVTILRESMVDGIAIAPCGLRCDHIVSAKEEKFPIVCVDGYFPDSGVPYVISDHIAGARMAVRHLLENGHSEIAFVQGYPDVQVSYDRLGGFKAELADYGIAVKDHMIVGEQFSYQSGYEAARKVLERQHPPTALFAVNNEIALGVLGAIQEKGLSVPGDVSVVAFDDLPWVLHLRIPLTTVAQNYEELGQGVVDLLVQSIQGDTPQQSVSVVVPVRLVERGSVRKLRSLRNAHHEISSSKIL
ncbi:MAG: LacI family DNA-binding transcriptional regulator [Candidatus Hydrogenedentes bacterium]|nr:LacI family DNA-binding transcriptional regulator [Candidatus Hydrogenedentota bacterium]